MHGGRGALSACVVQLLLLISPHIVDLISGFYDDEYIHWDINGVKSVCNPEEWICNPDNILRRNEYNRLIARLDQNKPAATKSGCVPKLHVVLVNNLVSDLHFGYPQGLSLIQLEPGLKHRWFQQWLEVEPYERSNAEVRPGALQDKDTEEPVEQTTKKPKCCSRLFLVSRKERGRMRYGAALCPDFPLRFCHIQVLFNRHGGGLFDPDYVNRGLGELWEDARIAIDKGNKTTLRCWTNRGFLTAPNHLSVLYIVISILSYLRA